MTHSEPISLGDNQPSISRTVAGVMRLNEWGYSSEELGNWIHGCIDLGISTFDHADIYGGYTCEAIFGEALVKTDLREKIQLITKCGIQLLSENRPETVVKHYNTSKEHIIWSAEQSLKNLQTDYLDMLLIHRPSPLMNADEIAEALTELVQSGKVLSIGVSNFKTWQFDLIQSRLDIPLMTNQIELSVAHTEPFYDGTLDQCQFLEIHPMIWSPLAGGRFFNPQDAQSHRLQEIMQEIANEIGNISIDQVALAWILKHPTKPINVLGSGKLERLKSGVEAEQINMSRQQWFRILEASHNNPVP